MFMMFNASGSAAVPDSQPSGAQSTRKSTGMVAKLLAEPSVVFGGVLLLAIAALGVLAPWLYTIDPTAIDPGSANLRPGTRGEFVTLAGQASERLFLFGTDA